MPPAVLAVLLLTAVASPSFSQSAPSLGAAFHAGVAVSDDPRSFYTAKLQASGALRGSIELPLFFPVSLELALQLHDTFASSLSGGWGYRSYWGWGARLAAGFALPLRSSSADRTVKAGAFVGASGNYDRYTWTHLFFFYSGLFLEPFLEFHFTALKRQSFSLIMPIDYFFRKDLRFSGSVGIGLQWRYYLRRSQ